MLVDLVQATIVFDLDDTLYYEDDYVESGIAAVAREIQRLYGRDLKKELLTAKTRHADIWQYACEAFEPTAERQGFATLALPSTPSTY